MSLTAPTSVDINNRDNSFINSELKKIFNKIFIVNKIINSTVISKKKYNSLLVNLGESELGRV